MSLLTTLSERRVAAQTELETLLVAPEAETRNLNDDEATEFDAVRTRINELDERIAQLTDVEARNTAANAARLQKDTGTSTSGKAAFGDGVRSEPRTYAVRGQRILDNEGNKTVERSYFRDLWLSERHHDTAANTRLARYEKELASEARAVNTTVGTGGSFIPPMYLEDDAILYARAGRVFANELTLQDLPGGTDSINIPKITGGTGVAVQATQNTAVTETDITDTFVTAPVITLAGDQTISVQALEQSPISFDEILFADLQLALNQQVDVQVIGGSGSGGNVTGVTNTSGVGSITSATAGAKNINSAVAYGAAQVAEHRFLPATHVFMTPTRWAWVVSQYDTAGRPLVVPDANGSVYNAFGNQGSLPSEGPVGTFAGLPVFLDSNLPGDTQLATPTADSIVVARPVDGVLYEGAVTARALPQTLGNQLSVLLQVYKYIAFAVRYAPSFQVISGAGLAALNSGSFSL